MSINKKIINLALMALVVWLPYAFVQAETTRDDLLKASNKRINGAYMRSGFLSLMKLPFDNDIQKKKALIVGDSYAQDFFNSIVENNYLKDYQIRTRYIPVRCQIFLGNPSLRLIEAKDFSFCEKADSLLKAKQQLSEADLIVFVSSWKQWSAQQLAYTIRNLQLAPQQKIVVIGKKSYGRINIQKYLEMPDDQLKTLRNQIDAKQTQINHILKNSLAEGVFIDQHEMVCGREETCPIFTNQMELISFDGGHLTKDGARYTGKILFQNPILSNL